MQRSTRFTLTAGSVALTAFVFSLTALNAGQGPPPQAPPAGTPPKPLVPVAASSVASNPDPYIGEFVTMTGAVEANLSKTSFSVDQDKTKPTGKDVLVLAPHAPETRRGQRLRDGDRPVDQVRRGGSGGETQGLQDRSVA